VTTHDPLTFVSVAGVMLIASAAACWLPTRRAAHLDPATTLRSE
jgi:ABC-type lipoprotein release transport system permease subunit